MPARSPNTLHFEKPHATRLPQSTWYNTGSVVLTVLLLALCGAESLWGYFGGPEGYYAKTVAIASGIVFIYRWGGMRRWRVRRVLMSVLAYPAFSALSLYWSPAPTYGSAKVGYFLACSVAPALAFAVVPKIPVRLIVLALALPGLIIAGAIAPTTSSIPSGLSAVNGIWLYRSVGVSGVVAFVAAQSSTLSAPMRLLCAAGAVGFGLVSWSGPYLGPVVAMLLAIGCSGTLGCCYRRSAVPVAQVRLAIIALLFGAALTVAWSESRDCVLGFSDDENIRTRVSHISTLLSTPVSARTLVGHGAGASAAALSQADIQVYAHNVVVEAYYEQGLLGLCLLLYPILASVSRFRCPTMANSLLSAYIVYSFTNAMFSGDIAHNASLWYSVSLAFAQLPDAVVRGRRFSTLEHKVAGAVCSGLTTYPTPTGKRRTESYCQSRSH